MPELQVSVVLPHYLRLAEGYSDVPEGEVVQVVAPFLAGRNITGHFRVRPTSPPRRSDDLDEIQKRRVRCSEQLLRRINSLAAVVSLREQAGRHHGIDRHG